MILHSYIFDRMELEVVEEIEPNFIVAKYGNAFGLYMQMDERQSKYFRNAGVRQYEEEPGFFVFRCSHNS